MGALPSQCEFQPTAYAPVPHVLPSCPLGLRPETSGTGSTTYQIPNENTKISTGCCFVVVWLSCALSKGTRILTECEILGFYNKRFTGYTYTYIVFLYITSSLELLIDPIYPISFNCVYLINWYRVCL